jgi:hypothetical protein
LLLQHNGIGTVQVSVEGGAAFGTRDAQTLPYFPEPENFHIYVGQGYRYFTAGTSMSFDQAFYGYIDEVKFVKGATAPPGTIASVGWADK